MTEDEQKMVRLIEIVRKLSSLVDDPEPGLFTWNQFLFSAFTDLADWFGFEVAK